MLVCRPALLPGVKQAMQSSVEKILYHTRLGSLWVKGRQKHLRALASSSMTESSYSARLLVKWARHQEKPQVCPSIRVEGQSEDPHVKFLARWLTQFKRLLRRDPQAAPSYADAINVLDDHYGQGEWLIRPMVDSMTRAAQCIAWSERQADPLRLPTAADGRHDEEAKVLASWLNNFK